MKTIQVGNLTIDGSRLFLIAGPCVIEGYDRTLMIGREVKRICEKLGVQYIFKASFDKANRSSYHSFRGPGLEEGLRILKSFPTRRSSDLYKKGTGCAGAFRCA